jgi:hypothetical protein
VVDLIDSADGSFEHVVLPSSLMVRRTLDEPRR